MGCLFTHTILSNFGSGFRGQILVRPWREGGHVLLDYGPNPVEISRAWGVGFERVAGRNAYVMTLGKHGDEQGGFSFNAAGSGAAPITASTGRVSYNNVVSHSSPAAWSKQV